MGGISIWQLVVLLGPGSGGILHIQAFSTTMPMSVLGMASFFQ